MALWEYKVITSGPHGFASLALLEAHVNALGKDEWEIIHFQTLPNNPLAFHGLARRSTVRDWIPPEIAVASAPKHSVYEPPVAAKPSVGIEEKRERTAALADEAEAPKPALETASLRPMRNTERDLDQDAEDEEDDWDTWEEDSEDLPTFFEAVKPHLRRNQKGPGMSVAVDYLAKRWDQREPDLIGALKECGFAIPETEEGEPEYLEFEGDLYWINRNNRGQLFINTREKPRPTFRVVQAKKIASDDPAAAELVAERAAEKAEIEKRKNERQERADRQAAAAVAKTAASHPPSEAMGSAPIDQGKDEPTAPSPSAAALPSGSGSGLLEKIRPLMRRNRRGPGYSGSVSFLSRALKQTDAKLTAALSALGLNPPGNANDKPVFIEIDDCVYWINKDSRGGIWINGREKRDGAPKPDGETETPAAPAATPETEGVEPTSPPTNPETPTPAAEEPVAPEPIREETNAVQAEPELPLEAPSSTPADLETSAPANLEQDPLFSAVRLLLKPNKRGSGVSGEVGFLSRALDKNEEEFLSALTGRGLSIPEDSKTKPVFVEHDAEIFWLNKSSGDGSLWLNAKASRTARRPSARTRAPRKAKSEEAPEEQDSPTGKES